MITLMIVDINVINEIKDARFMVGKASKPTGLRGLRVSLRDHRRASLPDLLSSGFPEVMTCGFPEVIVGRMGKSAGPLEISRCSAV